MNYVNRLSSNVLPTKKSQKGFTLIELVVVIVILGLLAAFAIPRFIDLGSEARAAVVRGLEGSIRSAAALAHSLQIAQNLGPAASVTMEGQVVTMANGYPTATAGGIEAALQANSTANFTSTVVGTVISFDHNGAATPANCSVSYTEPVANNDAPTIATPPPAAFNCD